MTRVTRLLIVYAILGAHSASGVQLTSGLWTGTIQLQAGQRIGVELRVGGTTDAPNLSMNAVGQSPSPVTAFQLFGNEITFHWGAFDCALGTDDGNEYSGKCSLSDGTESSMVLNAPAMSAVGDDFLNAAQLAATGAASLYDAVDRLKPQWLRARGGARSAQPVVVNVYLGGQQMGDISFLRSMQVDDVAAVQFFTASEASTRWGSHNTGGVIAVTPR